MLHVESQEGREGPLREPATGVDPEPVPERRTTRSNPPCGAGRRTKGSNPPCGAGRLTKGSNPLCGAGRFTS